MKVWILGSGSGGNATVLDNGSTRVLVDAGFSAREMARRFAAARIAPESIDAVVVTHEHTDHVRGVAGAAARWDWSVYATPGTLAGSAELSDAEVKTFIAGETLRIGSLRLETIPTSHDAAEPVAIVATDEITDARVGVATDLGEDSLRLRHALQGLDVLVLESNHDEVLLERGPYPVSVRRRIASRFGHLSNRAAGTIARACVHAGLQHLVLAHLSERCNTPEVALDTMAAALARSRFRGRITAASQRDVRGAFVASSRAAKTVQFSLGL